MGAGLLQRPARTTTSTTTAARRKEEEEEEEGKAGGAGTPGRVDRIFLPHVRTCADAATSLDARLGTQCCPRGRVKVCR